MKQLLAIFTLILSLLGSDYSYYEYGHLKELHPLPTKRATGNLLYFQDGSSILGAPNRVIFRLKPECGQSTPMTSPTDSVAKAFELSRKLFESGCVLYAHPDFLLFPKRRFDPLFDPQQWHLHNYGQFYSKPDIDLNIYEAWLYTKGAGVTLALIDDGFDTGHPDLQEAFIGGYSILFHTPQITPNNIYEFHGTLCAGLAGARLNGVGVVGVAPQADLYGVKLLLSDDQGNPLPIYSSDIVQAFLYASRADVISCSWGTYHVAEAVANIIEELATKGRNGKGIPIVFASGNDGMPQEYWAEDESALESVIAVGGVTNLGEHPWYSNYGPALDFVAPSGSSTLAISTTDLRGAGGLARGYYNHPDYTYATDLTGFIGTSAAAPQVAGVIALLLARDPDLTRVQIYAILRESAKKVGDLPYFDGRNDYFGYGLVDAKRALELTISRKVQREVQNRSYPIAGYFLNYGPNPFDWIYVSASLRLVGKLEGMEEDGTLRWRLLHFGQIFKEDRTISFIGAQDPFSATFEGKEFQIAGYFTRYGEGIFDWIYVSKGGKSYKLEGLDYTQHLLWIDLPMEGIVTGNMIQFR